MLLTYCPLFRGKSRVEKMEEAKRRFVGIDLGKREYTMAIIGKNGKMSIHHGKTSIQGRQPLQQRSPSK
jgi:hypothetical protein